MEQVIIYPVMFTVAALLSLLGVGVARRLALRLRVLDQPDRRKIHQEAVPYLGGLGIYVAFVTYTAICLLAVVKVLHPTMPIEWPAPALLAGGLLVAVGIWDDVKKLSAWWKLPFQIGAILFLTLTTDLRIQSIAHPFGGWIEFGPVLSVLVTVGWGVFLINAINLIDGLDGLAAGVVAISSLFLFVIYLIQGSYFRALLPLGLAGVCIGFLRYNFSPAKIFMGDAGSMFLGFTLAVFSMDQRLKGTTVVTLVFPLLVLGIPVIDTAMAFLRRLSKGKHPFQGDARHIHHRFLAIGLSDRQTVLIIYFFCIVFGLFALVMIKMTPAYRLATLALLLMLISFVFMAMSYLESRFLGALAEVNAYKDWIDFHGQDANLSKLSACAAPGRGDGAPPPDLKRTYQAPAISIGVIEKFLRAEEQRIEQVIVLARPDGRERLRRILVAHGHEAIVPASITEAQTMIAQGRAGVVIVEDIHAGAELAGFVTNARLTNSKTTILVLAASAEDQSALALLKLGAASILPACASDDVLEILIANALESRFLRRRLEFLNLLFWIIIFTIPIWIVIGRFIAMGSFY